MIDVSKYINAQFEDKGRGPKYDCLGLVSAVYKKEYGFNPLPDFRSEYINTGDVEGIGRCINKERKNWTQVSYPEEGAVIVFNIDGRPHHIGICTGFQQGHSFVLHIYQGTTAKNERLFSSIWKNRINSIYVYE